MALRMVCARSARAALRPHAVPALRMLGPTAVPVRHAASDAPSFRAIKVPTIEEARAAPQCLQELDHETLHLLAETGDHDACTERLRRNIMAVDRVDYMKAGEKIKEIEKCTQRGTNLLTFPYQCGILFYLTAGVGSIPMTFHKDTCLWFNDVYVTSEVPPPEDLESFYEVGSWSWSWVEPLVGTGCFVLMAFQMVRALMMNMNIKPYGNWAANHRAARVVKTYPQYNPEFVEDFAFSSSMRPGF